MALLTAPSDVWVRPATAQDDAAVARVQLRAWRTDHGAVLGAEALDRLDVAAVRARWTAAITAPPSPAHRVLVAGAGPRLVGLLAWVPDGPGVEVVALEVDPDARRAGHASRLLAACVDLARADGATHLTTWVLGAEPVRERFLGSAGLGPDGAERQLGLPGPADAEPVVERRWGAAL